MVYYSTIAFVNHFLERPVMRFLTYIVVLMILVLPSLASAADGLVGYWPLDDKTTPTVAKDLSGNGNDGSITGATFVDDGMGATAIKFDNSGDFVSIPAESFASITTEFTIAFMARGGDSQPQNGFTF